MSKFSGKCDLFDHISFQKVEDKGSYYESDEYECFELFKKRTNGILHQTKPVTVTLYNQDWVAEHAKGLRIRSFTIQKEDKRRKDGYANVVQYAYIYNNKVYDSLKELNKAGVYVDFEIRFDTILDLIPYYPYLISGAGVNEDREVVYISSESYVDSKLKESLEIGFPPSELYLDYKKRLQEHYLEVCKEYLLKDIEKRTHLVDIVITPKTPKDENYYYMFVPYELDENHPLEYVWSDTNTHIHFDDPKIAGADVVALARADVDEFIREDILRSYVQIKCVEINKRK